MIKAPPARRNAILDAALGVFARYGYRKTSIDDIARAADISKQGLYLHFASKDEVFAATLTKYLTDNRTAMEHELFRDGASLFERLVGAFDAWFGRHLDRFTPENLDLIAAGHDISGGVMDEYRAQFRTALARAFAESSEFQRAGSLCTPKETADVLLRLVETWKGERLSRSEFRKKIALAVRACVQIDR